MAPGRVRSGIGAVLVMLALSGPMPALGQDFLQVPPPVLTLDQERLFNGSRIAEQVSAEIEERSTALAAENREIEAKLVAEELDLTQRRPNLPPDEFRALADAFDEKVQAIRSEQDAKTRELQRQRDQERQNFIRRVSPVLANIVRERGALMVIDRRTVILSADTIDITDIAIERINAQFDANQPDTLLAPDPTPPDNLAPDAQQPTQP